MLDAAAVTVGRRLGCGAFATVYEAQLAGSRAKWVVKRLDRVAPEHAQQVRLLLHYVASVCRHVGAALRRWHMCGSVAPLAWVCGNQCLLQYARQHACAITVSAAVCYDVFVAAVFVAQVSNEVEVLTCAGSHPNLVPFRGWFVDSNGVLCLLLGHCEGGTLAALLKVRQW
jgi:serine/threonine protein kinase